MCCFGGGDSTTGKTAAVVLGGHQLKRALWAPPYNQIGETGTDF